MRVRGGEPAAEGASARKLEVDRRIGRAPGLDFAAQDLDGLVELAVDALDELGRQVVDLEVRLGAVVLHIGVI